jgi:hypothetical protein
VNSPEDEPVGPKHVEIRRYMNKIKIVTSVGFLFHKTKTRWEDNDLEDIKNMNVSNWKKVVQNRDSWKKAIEQDRTLYRL